MKIDLYIDFDGVILNTIDVMYKIMNDEYGTIDLDKQIVHKFVKSLNWEELIKNSSPINDSINNIKKLYDSNLFNIKILTHVNSDEEVVQKSVFVNKYLPFIEMISVILPNKKSSLVNAKGAILVDDYNNNLDDWKSAGGLPVKFSLKNKNYPYIKISSLIELKDRYEEIVKILL